MVGTLAVKLCDIIEKINSSVVLIIKGGKYPSFCRSNKVFLNLRIRQKKIVQCDKCILPDPCARYCGVFVRSWFVCVCECVRVTSFAKNELMDVYKL